MADHTGVPGLCSRPPTLDPAQYFNLSPAHRRAEEERARLRAQLKRQYQLQLNNPLRKELIEDPALTRWTYARTNVNPHFRATGKTSLLGAMFGVVPLFFWYFVFKTDRDKTEELIKAGKIDRKFNLSY